MQLDEIIFEIKAKHRRRCHAMESRKILDLRMGSLLRLELGWRRDLPEKERKRIAAEAAKLMEGEEAHQKSREPYQQMEADAKKAMARLARQLPVWDSFCKHIRGFGTGKESGVSLAVIVAEAGDLSNYANPGKLWKRLGLAPGQNRIPPGLSKEQQKQAWIDRGYSPRRRSHMWNIGDALIKGNRDGKYRTIYLERKAYEKARAAETKEELTDMHAHLRAQRYMEKRLLKDLWRAWRAASVEVTSDQRVPLAEIPPAMEERAAISMMRPIPDLPLASIQPAEAERAAIRRLESNQAVPLASIGPAEARETARERVKSQWAMPSPPIRRYPEGGYEWPALD